MKISFARPFRKLHGGNNNSLIKSATLIQVLKVKSKSELSAAFIEYDTDGEYEIPDDCQLLLLLFLANTKDKQSLLFTTIRRWTQDREVYYLDSIKKEFEIEIE